MRILVTGATGFVGSHLVDMLKETGHDVKALLRLGVQRSFVPLWMHDGTVEIMSGEITNSEDVKKAVKDADVVFHLAALVGKWHLPESEYYRVNVLGTKILVDQCSELGVGHFVFLSTTAVMRRTGNVPPNISHPLSPVSYYEKTKYQAELEVRDAIYKKDFPATIIRSTHVYGPGDKDFVKLFRLLKWLRVFPLVNGGYNVFQPIYVKDLARALILCMEKRSATERKSYIVAGPERVTFSEFLHLAAEIMDARIITLNIPVGLAWATANINEGVGTVLNREPPLTRSRVKFFTENYLYDVKEIHEDTGFAPKVDAKTGLFETIGWCKNHGVL